MVQDTGNDFPAVQRGDIALGQTSYNDIIQRFGTPHQQSQKSFSDMEDAKVQFKSNSGTIVPHAAEIGTYSSLAYLHTTAKAPIARQPIVLHSLALELWNGKVVSYGHLLSASQPLTPLDAGTVEALRRPGTRLDDVIARLGEPTGRMIYPAYAVRGGQVLLYRSRFVHPAAEIDRDRRVYVFVDSAGLITDVKESESERKIEYNTIVPGGM